MAEADIGFAGVAERERFGQEFLCVDLRVEPLGNLRFELLQHHAAGDTREGLARGSHVRVGVAVGFAEIFLEHEVAFADHD